MKEVRKYLQYFGFSDESITIILKTYPICNMQEDTILNHCIENNQWFLKNGYTKRDIIKMVNSYPSLYSLSIDNINQKITDLVKLGYTKDDVIKMTKYLPALYGLGIDSIKQKIEDLIKLGYTKKEVVKMTKYFPALYSYSIDTINKKIEDLVKLGYTKEEVIRMEKEFPALFGLGNDNIKQKIDDIIELGYTKEEVIKMTKSLPSLYGYSIDRIKEKIEYLRKVNLDSIVTEDAKRLMQSVDLTYARYEFLTNQGKTINRENYRLLFDSNKQFTKRYGVTKQQLIAMYPYKERIKKKEMQLNNNET